MSSPGFSVTELLQAVKRVKHIYDAFFDKYENANSRVNELASAIELFHTNLFNHEWILRKTGRHYPGHAAFLRSLEECEAFLYEYKAILGNPSTLSQKSEKWWKTTCWPFENAHVDRLVRQLNIHIQAMAGFTLNLLLSKAYHDDQDLVTLPSIPRQTALTIDGQPHVDRMVINRQSSTDPSSELVHLYTKVQTLQNRHKRQSSLAVQRGRPVDHTPFQRELQVVLEEWREMILKTGLAENKLPELPSANPLDFSEDYWRRALNASLQTSNMSVPIEIPSTSKRLSGGGLGFRGHRDSLSVSPGTSGSMSHSPFSDSSASPSSLFGTTPASMGDPHITPSQGNITGVQVGIIGDALNNPNSFSIMPPPALMPCKAILKFPDDRIFPHDWRLTLGSYRIVRSQDRQYIQWFKNDRPAVKHQLPTSKAVHPYTKHQSLHKPHEVSFRQKHRSRLEGKTPFEGDPHYTFATLEDYKQFQSAIRDKELLEVFEVEAISSSLSSKRQGEASNQHLKLWKSFDSPQHSLSFFADAPPGGKECHHMEFPVSWFNLTIESRKGGVLRLNFEQTPPAKRRISSIIRRSSVETGGGTSTLFRTPTGTTTNSTIIERRTSATSSLSSRTEHEDRQTALHEEAMKMKFLDILLSNLGDEISFIRAFEQAHSQSSSTLDLSGLQSTISVFSKTPEERDFPVELEATPLTPKSPRFERHQ